MACNYDNIFAQIDERLSQQPATHLYELVQQLGCSPSIIERAVQEHSQLSFRDCQRKRQLEKAYLLICADSLELMQPTVFSSMEKQVSGASIVVSASEKSVRVTPTVVWTRKNIVSMAGKMVAGTSTSVSAVENMVSNLENIFAQPKNIFWVTQNMFCVTQKMFKIGRCWKF